MADFKQQQQQQQQQQQRQQQQQQFSREYRVVCDWKRNHPS